MKKYRYKFSVSIIVILSLIVAVTCVGIGLSVFNATQYVATDNLKFISNVVAAVINLAVMVFGLCFLAFSYYSVGEKYVCTRFGLFYNKIKTEDLSDIVLFKSKEKLVVYLKNDKFFVVVISPVLFDDFVDSLKAVNPSVGFNIKQDDVDINNEKK